MQIKDEMGADISYKVRIDSVSKESASWWKSGKLQVSNYGSPGTSVF